MENTSDSFILRPLLLRLKDEKQVCYSVLDNTIFNYSVQDTMTVLHFKPLF